MRIDPALLEEARVQATHVPLIKKLLEFYDYVTENSIYETYVARMVTLNKWNEDLIKGKISIITPESLIDDEKSAEEDAKKRDKDVDRVLKFLEKQVLLIEDTEKLRNMLSPDIRDNISTDKRLNTIKPIAL